MDLLKEIQRKLDTHTWGEVRYMIYTINGKFEKKIPYRKCEDCHCYDNPNGIAECPVKLAKVLA